MEPFVIHSQFSGTSNPVGTTNWFVYKAPDESYGGGFRVLEAGGYSETSIAKASAPFFRLLKASTAHAVNGTIGSTTLGTLATNGWVAGTPQAVTISSTNNYVDANEYLVWEVSGTAAGVGSALTFGQYNIHLWVNCQFGK